MSTADKNSISQGPVVVYFEFHCLFHILLLFFKDQLKIYVNGYMHYNTNYANG